MDSSSNITGHDYGQGLRESNSRFGSMDLVTFGVFVEIADEGSKVVSL
jgi:hypothetical protein